MLAPLSVFCMFFCKIWDQVPSVTGGACCFRWVSRLRTYREGTTVGNVTNIVCISTLCSQRFGRSSDLLDSSLMMVGSVVYGD